MKRRVDWLALGIIMYLLVFWAAVIWAATQIFG
jgi:hypothetical protein